MSSGFVIRENQYYDSVFLMGVNKRLSQMQGVQQTAALMGSERNKQLLAQIGVRGAAIDAAQPNDLIVAAIADTSQTVDALLASLDQALQAIEKSTPASTLHTLEEGLAEKPHANLALISVPGEYATREAMKALESGLNVFLFSSNVPLEQELHLKRFAAERGLLVMGPDCGTSLIGGVGIGFANAVRRGTIGAIGPSGTGLQEFTCQVHHAGLGISHAIGAGSHDLSDEIGGLTTLAALDALEADPQTEVIALVAKPPGAATLRRLTARLRTCAKPVVGCFLGARLDSVKGKASITWARTIDEAALAAVRQSGAKGAPPSRSSPQTAFGVRRQEASPPTIQLTEQERALASQTRSMWAAEQRHLRGVFAGGTFVYQSQQILHEAGLVVHSNAPLDPRFRLDHPDRSQAHTIVDMGDDDYTLGKPHPMIDGATRRERILAESHDPSLAILLLDFILGYNASMDPVGELLDAIVEARQAATRRGGALTVVASICGTEGDPQDLNLQATMLREAGAIVFRSNALAALFCCELLKPV
ncbi:MAG TPA: acyl-CoA synthetase FdrA [Anaerolineales bacterium]|nr:acyl-CoA synthetase FdrA [Anaerolineales bacterium]